MQTHRAQSCHARSLKPFQLQTIWSNCCHVLKFPILVFATLVVYPYFSAVFLGHLLAARPPSLRLLSPATAPSLGLNNPADMMLRLAICMAGLTPRLAICVALRQPHSGQPLRQRFFLTERSPVPTSCSHHRSRCCYLRDGCAVHTENTSGILHRCTHCRRRSGRWPCIFSIPIAWSPLL